MKISEIVAALRSKADEIEKQSKDASDKMTIEDAVKFYFQLKSAYDELDEQRKRIYSTLDALNKAVLPDRLEDAGMDLIRMPELERSFYIVPKMSASIVDKEKGHDWLIKHNLGALITQTVNAGTLASAMKKMVEEQNLQPPEDIIKLSPYRTIGSSKYKPKAK